MKYQLSNLELSQVLDQLTKKYEIYKSRLGKMAYFKALFKNPPFLRRIFCCHMEIYNICAKIGGRCLMKIREMTIEDYQQVYALWASTGMIQLKKSDERSEIARMIQQNPTTCLVGEKDDQIIAAVMGGFDGRRGMIHHLAVHPSAQGRGYGNQILAELEKRFIDLGVMKVNLFVLDSNKKVVQFYDQLGYVQRHELIAMSKTLLDD